MISQIIATIIVLLLFIKVFFNLRSNKITIQRFFFWIILGIILILIVYFPEFVIYSANLVGIERAKDLPIYISITLLFYLIFKIFGKLESIERDITTIVKEISLGEKKK